jgi:hypothetical protein
VPGSGTRLPSGLVVTLTTIPSRFDALELTLKSLLRQTARAAEIRVCVPEWSVREGRAYVVPTWWRELPGVMLVRCVDEGPATKFLPTLRTVDADQAVLVVDDDRVYHPRLLEELGAAAAARPEVIVSVAGWSAPADRIDRPTTLAVLLVCDHPDGGSAWVGNLQSERRIQAGEQELQAQPQPRRQVGVIIPPAQCRHTRQRPYCQQ